MLRTLVLALAVGLPFVDLLFAQPAAVVGKKYALLVGVNEYDNRKLANLSYAERDVTELAKVLERNGFTVTMLLGSASGAEKATRANIEKAVADHLGKVTKRDTLLTAFAGQGSSSRRRARRRSSRSSARWTPSRTTRSGCTRSTTC